LIVELNNALFTESEFVRAKACWQDKAGQALKSLGKIRMNQAEESGTSTRVKSRSPYMLWLLWVVWLPFTIPILLALLQTHLAWPLLLAELAGLTLFVGVYLQTTLSSARRLVATPALAQPAPVLTWLPVILLTLLSSVLVASNGLVWGGLFIFTAACSSGRLPTLQAICVALVLIAIMLVGSWYSHFDWSQVWQGVELVTMVSVVVMVLRRSIATDRELREARAEIARLAVTTERLRIARDLHDLLGHSLSLIALKSELAGRLLQVAPERAAGEIHDVEQVARTTLEEVREAVSNYRQPTLASELHAASEMLSAAGITYLYQGAENALEALPAALEAPLAWTVREGVTNVIRHSQARHCTIQITRDKHAVSLEVLDDGQGAPADTAQISGRGGNGLRGLKERVLAHGGRCEAGPRAEQGFCLAVWIPLREKLKHAGSDEKSNGSASQAARILHEETEERR
jgi:two-component system sensor histidine kinase DesK